MRNKDYFKKIYDLGSWQGIHVGQLAYTRNLVMILATASLGFTINLLLDKNLTECGKIIGIKTSSGLLLSSILFGLVMAILESENYRLKYKIGRMIENHEGNFEKLPEDIGRLQRFCSNLETTNRFLIYGQLFLFLTAVGILTFMIL